MKLLEKEFTKNANQLGLHVFKQVKRETLPNGKHAYIYVRTDPKTNKVQGYEVVVPQTKKAGTYPVPNGGTITYDEDFEVYPSASQFGIHAWFCVNPIQAEKELARLMQDVRPQEKNEDGTVKVRRGRKAAPKVSLDLPEVEFSVKELAAMNKVGYPIAYMFVKEAVVAGTIQKSGQRKGTRKPTQLFKKLN